MGGGSVCVFQSRDRVKRSVPQGRSDGSISVFIPLKSAQVNFLRGKRTSERLFNSFIPPKKLLHPQNKFLATPLMYRGLIVQVGQATSKTVRDGADVRYVGRA